MNNNIHYFKNDLLGQKILITEQQYTKTTTENINHSKPNSKS